MKKWNVILMLMVLLSGCRTEQTMETVADDILVPVIAEPARISVALPGETALPVMENDNGRVYICNEYEIQIQTMDAGNVAETLRTLSGMDLEDVTLVQTCSDGISRYEFVWAAAGEAGDQTGRAVILDDSSYHYCMSVLHPTDSDKSHVNWDQVFSSFALVSY